MGDRETARAFIRQAEQTVADNSKPTYLQHGYQLFASACMADPTYAEAFYLFGNHNSDLRLTDAAIASWRRAIECGPAPDLRAKILTNLGWQLQARGDTEEAHDLSREAIRLDPTASRPWLNLSLIRRDQRNVLGMVEAAEKAFALEPTDIHNEIALAFAYLFAGRYAEGFRHFEKRFEWRLHNFTQYPYERWKGETGKTVFLVADQGLGDTLAFSRFVPEVCGRSRYVHLSVQPGLLRLFSHAFVDIPNLNIMPMGQPFPAADAWTTFVSLPHALGLSDEQIRTAPHIKVEPFGKSRQWLVPDRTLHVAIQWSGSPLNDIDQHRNVPLHFFSRLHEVPGIQLYAFQLDERADELAKSGYAGLVRDMKPYISDVMDTLSFLRDIDLVVCCESALAHIAALAGKECWIPYSYLGRDYRAGVDGSKKLWTPNHTFFPQGTDRNWAPVFDKIILALRERL